MSRNGSGTYTNPYADFVSGTVIASAEVDNNFSDIATALTQSIAVDGQSTVTADIPMSTQKLTGLSAGSAAGHSIRYEQVIPDLSSLVSINGHGMWGNRNLLINGDHRVDQDGTDTRTGLGAAEIYLTDMHVLSPQGSATARWTASKEASGGTSGKAAWLKLLCTTADASPGASESQSVEQRIEAQNALGLLDDSGDVVAGTMSTDIILHADGASSITFPATVGVYFEFPDGARSYVGLVTVTAADTWENVSLSHTADVTAFINNDSGIGVKVGLCLYGGASELLTAGWSANTANPVGATGAENIADATSNYLGYTEIQYEIGSTATKFEHRPIADEKLACFRHYERHQPTLANATFPCVGVTYSSTNGAGRYFYDVEKRATPTVVLTAGSTFNWIEGDVTQQNCGTVSAALIDERGFEFATGTLTSAATGGGWLKRDATDTAYVAINARL